MNFFNLVILFFWLWQQSFHSEMIADVLGSERGGECDDRHTIGDKWDGANYPRIASKSNWTANIPRPKYVQSIPEILKNGLES